MIVEIYLAEIINSGLLAVAIVVGLVMAAGINNNRRIGPMDAEEQAKIAKRVEGGYEYKNTVRHMLRLQSDSIGRLTRLMALVTTEEARNILGDELRSAIDLRDQMNELLMYKDRD